MKTELYINRIMCNVRWRSSLSSKLVTACTHNNSPHAVCDHNHTFYVIIHFVVTQLEAHDNICIFKTIYWLHHDNLMHMHGCTINGITKDDGLPYPEVKVHGWTLYYYIVLYAWHSG